MTIENLLIILFLCYIFCYGQITIETILLMVMLMPIIGIVSHLEKEYCEYKEQKRREEEKRQLTLRLKEREKQKKIKEEEYWAKVRKSVERIYKEIREGKRAPLDFYSIMYERLSRDNPRVREFCIKNGISFDELVEIKWKYY